MLRLRGLPLVALLTPLTLAAAPKGKGDGLTQKEIVDVIQSHSDDAVTCYKEATGEDKSVDGKVKIRFLIGLNGKIEASQVEQNTFKDKTIGNCIRTKMNAWKFPKPRGGQKINTSYPFEFKVAKAPAPTPEAPAAPAAPTTPAAPGAIETPAAAPAAPATPPSPEAPEAPTQAQ